MYECWTESPLEAVDHVSSFPMVFKMVPGTYQYILLNLLNIEIFVVTSICLLIILEFISAFTFIVSFNSPRNFMIFPFRDEESIDS